MTVVMEGYDAILIGNFWAYPTFQRKYGRFVGVTDTTKSGYQVEPAWQAGIGNGAGVGAFFGALLNGMLVNKFGQRNTIVGALVVLCCFIFVVFFAENKQTLLAGQLLCGLPWGVFATSAPAYASEMLPMVLRVYFTSWTNMCFIIGQFIAAGVLRACLIRTDEWGFRIPFALQVGGSHSYPSTYDSDKSSGSGPFGSFPCCALHPSPPGTWCVKESSPRPRRPSDDWRTPTAPSTPSRLSPPLCIPTTWRRSLPSVPRTRTVSRVSN